MFNNEIFDSWLNKKSDEILSKVDREKISTEEMIILVLKAQTNHFHHTDIDLKKGMSQIEVRMDGFENRLNTFENKVEQRFERIDQKIDSRFMWTIGIIIATSGGLYLKLFLG